MGNKEQIKAIEDLKSKLNDGSLEDGLKILRKILNLQDDLIRLNRELLEKSAQNAQNLAKK